MKENLEHARLHNTEPILGDFDDPKLPPGILDAIFIIDTYHEIADYKAMLSHLRKSLRKGGRLLVLEKLKEYAKNDTRELQTRAHTLSSKYAMEELLAAGFKIILEITDFGKWN